MNSKVVIFLVIAAAAIFGVWLAFNPTPSSTTAQTGTSASTTTATTGISDPAKIKELQENLFLNFLKTDPEQVSQLRLFGNQPDPTGDQLTDLSAEAQQKNFDYAKNALAEIRSLDRSKLSFEDETGSEILEWFFDDISRGEAFAYDDYPVSPGFGLQNAVVTLMTDYHEIHSRQDAENYVARLSKFGTKFDQITDGLKARAEHGNILPKTLLDIVLNDMKTLISTEPAKNPIYLSFVRRLGELQGISDQDKAALTSSVEQEMTQTVYPAYQKLIGYLQSIESNAPGDDQVGVWRFPDGDAYYAYLVRHNTTTDLTPEELHQIGLSEVARIQGELTETLTGMGFKGANFGEIYRNYRASIQGDPNFNYPDTDAGRAQVLADYKGLIDEALSKVGSVFDLTPKARIEVRAVPPYQQDSAPGAYYDPPSFDGSRPGVFYVNLAGLPLKPGMRTLTYHEAVPGHYFQIAIEQESKSLPIFQKVIIFTAHAEGWALYSEKLARSLGLYADPYSKISNLWSELFRAARLVLDTGIHYKRWSMQQAMDYAFENVGFQLQGEIIRYISIPGQALSYKTGELKFLELRERAKKALGDKFDLKEFHNLILGSGGMPLTTLEKVVDHYIQTKQSK
ncbi:DUF885 domain-containing protein [Candidatus Acetothermia bacterium]|nr:DUF885 domain-containing protein [Candidatus Acetothermia bacterium]MBI3644180.1 DUF885 domain-containing protein [Candidatus Acetothermia bacterium]